MNAIRLFSICILLGACSSAIKRDRWSDKGLRVMIDPDPVSANHYVKIESALVNSGKFMVVDRGAGFQAIQKEQERAHREQADRFDNKEKWAHWGKLYGVGSILVPHVQCERKPGFWNPNTVKLMCQQHLSLVDSNTGEVMAVADAEASTDLSYDFADVAPDWSEAVDRLVQAYPKDWNAMYYAKPALEYQDLSIEEALRQQELPKRK